MIKLFRRARAYWDWRLKTLIWFWASKVPLISLTVSLLGDSSISSSNRLSGFSFLSLCVKGRLFLLWFWLKRGGFSCLDWSRIRELRVFIRVSGRLVISRCSLGAQLWGFDVNRFYLSAGEELRSLFQVIQQHTPSRDIIRFEWVSDIVRPSLNSHSNAFFKLPLKEVSTVRSAASKPTARRACITVDIAACAV